MAIKKITYDDKITAITSPLDPTNKIMAIDFNEIKNVVNDNADFFKTNKQNKLKAGYRIKIVNDIISYTSPETEKVFTRLKLVYDGAKLKIDQSVFGQVGINWGAFSALSFSGYLKEATRSVNFCITVGTGQEGIPWWHSIGIDGDRIIGIGMSDTWVFYLQYNNGLDYNQLELFYGGQSKPITSITNLWVYGKRK